MSTFTIINMMLLLLSGLIILAGAYAAMGFCCRGERSPKLFGGFLGLVGFSTFILTIIPV